MKYLIILLVAITAALGQACSTTSSDARNILRKVSEEDKSTYSNVRLSINSDSLVTSSQDSGRLFKLHESKSDIRHLAVNIAEYYGFNVVSDDQAEFQLVLKLAQPDGGACVEGLGVATKGLSFSASILTLGISPATSSHCFIVSADLFYVLNDEDELIGEFISNEGRVEVYAGANEVDNYQLTVSRHDEEKAIETSMVGLFNAIISAQLFR